MLNGKNLLEAISEIVHDKKIEKTIILEGIKDGFQKAYEKFFDPEAIINVEIDESSGDIKVFRELKVVQKVEDEWLEIGLNKAKELFDPNITIGDKVYEPVKFNEKFSKLAVMQVGQIIKQKIREGEKNKIYQEFLPKKNEIVGGFVKDITETSYLVEVDGSIIPIWNKKLIPGEKFEVDQAICFYVEDVLKDNKHSQVVASRTHNQFLAKLMEINIPEVMEGIIEVKRVARMPGKRAKVAVCSHEEGIDPIGSCVGTNGNRIKNIIKELNGENIDVVLYSDDLNTFIINAISPAKVISIEINENHDECIVVVPDCHLFLTIGKKGMSIRLVANLVNIKINVFTLSCAKNENIKVLWNGNITESEVEILEASKNNNNIINNKKKQDDDFKNKDKKNKNYKKSDIDFLKNIEQDEQEIFIEQKDSSIDEIQASIAAFESLNQEDNVDEFDETDDEDYDHYYRD